MHREAFIDFSKYVLFFKKIMRIFVLNLTGYEDYLKKYTYRILFT